MFRKVWLSGATFPKGRARRFVDNLLCISRIRLCTWICIRWCNRFEYAFDFAFGSAFALFTVSQSGAFRAPFPKREGPPICGQLALHKQNSIMHTILHSSGQRHHPLTTSRTVPTKTDPTKTAPANTAPAITDPAKAAPAITAPARTAPAGAAPARTARAMTAPAKMGQFRFVPGTMRFNIMRQQLLDCMWSEPNGPSNLVTGSNGWMSKLMKQWFESSGCASPAANAL